jgi:glycosyltransferase involved in cell wall biosynthesis
MEKNYLRMKFEGWVKNITSFDFASDNMKSFVLARASSCHKARVVWSSLGLPSAPPPENRDQRTGWDHKNDIIIIFCGSVRFRNEMRAFAEALESLNKRGITCKFRILTSRIPFSIKAAWLPYIADHDQLISELKKCDFAYSPMEFDVKNCLLAQTSFPGKIMDYIQAGLPIIAHAPGYAASYEFVRKNDLGIGIDSIDPEAIAASLSAFFNNQKNIQTQKDNAAATIGLFYRQTDRSNYFNRLFNN